MGNASSGSSTNVTPGNFGQNDAPVVVYSKTTCPYCVKAKNLLKDENIGYVAFELNKMADGAQIASNLRNHTGLNYVPQIFICGNLVGGFSELAKLQEEGTLREMTEKCLKSDNARIR